MRVRVGLHRWRMPVGGGQPNQDRGATVSARLAPTARSRPRSNHHQQSGGRNRRQHERAQIVQPEATRPTDPEQRPGDPGWARALRPQPSQGALASAGSRSKARRRAGTPPQRRRAPRSYAPPGHRRSGRERARTGQPPASRSRERRRVLASVRGRRGRSPALWPRRTPPIASATLLPTVTKQRCPRVEKQVVKRRVGVEAWDDLPDLDHAVGGHPGAERLVDPQGRGAQLERPHQECYRGQRQDDRRLAPALPGPSHPSCPSARFARGSGRRLRVRAQVLLDARARSSRPVASIRSLVSWRRNCPWPSTLVRGESERRSRRAS